MITGRKLDHRKFVPTHLGTICLAHSLEGFYLNLSGQWADVL